ncbi:hypothetical protein M8J76_000863 [Diaphorina citri]|nr:hypothetical protein M8J76_000863 [Diaphorina citri]
MDNSNVRKNIPISILKRRANEMRSDHGDGIQILDEPQAPKPPSPTLLNQLRKLMGTNKDTETPAPPPPIISQSSYEEKDAPPPPTFSRGPDSPMRQRDSSPPKHPPPPVINLESEGTSSAKSYYETSNHSHHPPHYPPMSHPHPHMQRYPPMMNPYPHPGFPTDYSGPSPMQYHHPMGMAPPGYVYPGYPQGPQQPPMQMMMPVQNNGSVAPTPPTSATPEKDDSLQQLLKQREVYITKAKSLNKDLERLKEHRAELLTNKKSAQTSAFVAENEKLQEEIKSKIKGIDNIVEMLGKIISDTETKIKDVSSGIPLSLGGSTKLGKRSRSSSSSSLSSSSSSSSSSSTSSADSKHATRKAKKHRKSRSSSSSDGTTSRRHKKRDTADGKSERDKSTERRFHEELLRMEIEHKRRQEAAASEVHAGEKSREREKRESHRVSRERESRDRDKQRSRRHSRDRDARRHSRERHDDRNSERSRKRTSLDRENSKKSAPEDTRVKIEEPDKRAAKVSEEKVDRKVVSKVVEDARVAVSEDKRQVAKVVEPYEEGVNYNFYDPEIHWCRVCNVFPRTVKAFLLHLQEEAHMAKIIEKNSDDRPWHELPAEATPPVYDDPNVISKPVPIRGVQMFVPVTGWYCKLCDTWIGDLHCASVHLKSIIHAKRYNTFTEENPHWEIEWLSSRTRAFEKSLKDKASGVVEGGDGAVEVGKEADEKKRLTIAFDKKTDPRKVIKPALGAYVDDSATTDANPEPEGDLQRDMKLFDEWQKTSVRESELTEVISNLKGKVIQKLKQSVQSELKAAATVDSGDSRRRSRDRDHRRPDRERDRRERSRERERDRSRDRGERDRSRERGEREKTAYQRERDQREKMAREREGRGREQDREGRREQRGDSANDTSLHETDKDRKYKTTLSPSPDVSFIFRTFEGPPRRPKLWKPSPEDKAAYMSELDKRALETEKKLEREVWRAKVEAEKLLNHEKRVQEARGGKGLMIGRMPFLNRKRDQVKKGSNPDDKAKQDEKKTSAPEKKAMDFSAIAVPIPPPNPKPSRFSDATHKQKLATPNKPPHTASLSGVPPPPPHLMGPIPLPPGGPALPYGPVLPPPRQPLRGPAPNMAQRGPAPNMAQRDPAPNVPPMRGPAPPSNPPSRTQLEKLKENLNQKLREVVLEKKKELESKGLSGVEPPPPCRGLPGPPPSQAPGSDGFKPPPPPPGTGRNRTRFDNGSGKKGEPPSKRNSEPPTPSRHQEPPTPSRHQEPPTPSRHQEPPTPMRGGFDDDDDDLAMLGITSDDLAAQSF